ncbi:hypothetical protein PAXRUDRAFT_16086 [Paxillus rubicundulus Ve08.2h10]|uniref:Uncharacterized protein n=1 Tax=Paxillus rubicundulus Ve08.2h10 TaxID=930991 RepID=A0A0D0CAH2_9AGAM|nr:hypothetical protein PAXRUDRAFT_16086 [Paxillus rubicundulus Ve08.2h10]
MGPPRLSWDEDNIINVFGSECSDNNIDDYFITKVPAEDKFLNSYIGDAKTLMLL